MRIESRSAHPLLLGLLAATTACAEDPTAQDIDDTPRLADRYDIPEGVEVAFVDFGRGPVEVAYTIEDGLAVFGGDMLLGEAATVAARSLEIEEQLESSEGLRGAVLPGGQWPSNVIRYAIDPEAESQAAEVDGAITMWEQATMYRFVEWTGELDEPYIRFTATNEGCRSAVGRQLLPPGVGQLIRLDGTCATGNVAHEIGHALGLIHEHTRMDRDDHIILDWNNIDPDVATNFWTYPLLHPGGEDWWSYDFDSLMHYGSTSGAVDPGKPTMLRNQQGCSFGSFDSDCWIQGQRSHLSIGDISGATRVLTESHPGRNIVNDATQLCLRPENGFFAPGTRIVEAATCPSDSDSRRWVEFHPEGNGPDFVLVNKSTGMCMTHDPTTDFIVQDTCTNSEHQQFRWITATENTAVLKLHAGRCVRRSDSSGVFLSNGCGPTEVRRWKVSG